MSCNKDSTLSVASTEYGFGNLDNNNNERSSIKDQTQDSKGHVHLS